MKMAGEARRGPAQMQSVGPGKGSKVKEKWSFYQMMLLYLIIHMKTLEKKKELSCKHNPYTFLQNYFSDSKPK